MLETTLREANRLRSVIFTVEDKISKMKEIKEKEYSIQVTERKKKLVDKTESIELVGPAIHLAVANVEIIRQLFQNEVEILEKELAELKEKFAAL